MKTTRIGEKRRYQRPYNSHQAIISDVVVLQIRAGALSCSTIDVGCRTLNYSNLANVYSQNPTL